MMNKYDEREEGERGGCNQVALVNYMVLTCSQESKSR